MFRVLQCRSRAALAGIVAAAVLCGTIAGLCNASPVAVAGTVKVAPPVDESVRRSTAVTLNYCRASFHRIQQCPTLRVLMEEQEKILNNLDLNGIADQDVIKLYTAVLVEISEIRLSGRERQVIQERYQTSLGTVLTADAFDFGAQLASAHYLSAIRTGARSWWDYRNVSVGRETDVFHVDQKRMMAFTEKSAQFLDTFWKLARDRHIPDRWLVRNQDLTKLDVALQTTDLNVRLRVLKRMEDFMNCYPPYWYYLARTQQALGQLAEAAATYDRLLTLGLGHFRKDDMLAAGLANRAVIEEYLHRPDAVPTALKALDCSTEVWEANLTCACVLGRNGRTAEAEDAILRNLDVGLEREQSAAALTSLYIRAGDIPKLQARLCNPSFVYYVPIPLLVRAAALLGPHRLPFAVTRHWAASLSAHYDMNFGPDDFVVDTIPGWNLQASEMSLVLGSESNHQSTISLLPGHSKVRFAKVAEVGHPLYAVTHAPPAALIVRFPETPLVRVRLETCNEPQVAQGGSSIAVFDLLTSTSRSGHRQGLSIASLEIGEVEFPVASRLAGGSPGFEIEGPPVPAVMAPVSRGPVPPAASAQAAAVSGASPSNPGVAQPSRRTAPPVPMIASPKVAAPKESGDNSGPGPVLFP